MRRHQEEAALARRPGRPVTVLHGEYLHMIVDRQGVADALRALLAALPR